MKPLQKFLKNQIAVSIIAAAIIISAGIISYAIINKGGNNTKTSILDSIMSEDKYFNGDDFNENEYILGNKENKITLLVYSDFECPYCKNLQENTIQKLQKKYSLDENDYKKAKISIVYRHFALSFHDKAPTESNASLCVRELYGQNAYINFINRLYSITPANNGLDLSILPDIAKYAVDEAKNKNQNINKDFDLNELVNCINTMPYNDEFLSNHNDAISAGLEGTPYSLILYKDKDGQLIVQKISGAIETSYFEKIIDKLLKI